MSAPARTAIGLSVGVALVTALTGALLTAPTGAALRALPDPGPGSAGIGDPYYPAYGNGGYRVGHYEIDVAYDPDSRELTGRTVIEAVAAQDLSRFNLDLLLEAETVEVDGEPAAFRSKGKQELVVTPARPIAEAAAFEVDVTYSGVPARIDGPGLIQPWVTTPDGAVAIGEPEIAAWWFPSNDHPRDAARFDISITVPAGVEAISNGAYDGTETGPRTDTWHWSSRLPMATYLAFMAIGQYRIDEGTDGRGRPYLFAVSRGLSAKIFDAARRSMAQTPKVTRWLERQFGPYPFDQTGGVVPGGSFGFALENQTRPTYSSGFFGGVNTWVVAHEMAHQWYGDAVRVHNWRDIWLNEGFATYAEYLFFERRFGVSTQQSFLNAYRVFRPGDDFFWGLRIGDPGARNEFAYPVYERGAMTLQALRNKLGARDFFALLREWGAIRGNREIAQFVALAEAYRGGSLDRFFRVWLYTPEKPAATVRNGVYPTGGAGAGSPLSAEVERHVGQLRQQTRALARAERGRHR